MTNALVEWHGWLEDLAERFERYPLAGLSYAEHVVHLIHHVADRTGAGGA